MIPARSRRMKPVRKPPPGMQRRIVPEPWTAFELPAAHCWEALHSAARRKEVSHSLPASRSSPGSHWQQEPRLRPREAEKRDPPTKQAAWRCCKTTTPSERRIKSISQKGKNDSFFFSFKTLLPSHTDGLSASELCGRAASMLFRPRQPVCRKGPSAAGNGYFLEKYS